MIKEVQSGKADKLIVDLRYNVGGTYLPNSRLIKTIKDNKKINREGNLMVVIGRNTFCSGICYAIELKKNTNAIFFGEPTGAKPNHFGDSRFFRLQNSGLAYSTKYFDLFNEEIDSFYPDIMGTFSINDYLDNKDPFLEDVLRSI